MSGGIEKKFVGRKAWNWDGHGFRVMR